MLHYETISSETLAILKHFQSCKTFHGYKLVGGTALALMFGHRISVDLDFFGDSDLEISEINDELKKFGKITILKNSPTIKIINVNGIKVDIVKYNYPWIDLSITEDGLTLASVKDIGAMKIAAITGRGSKKDFYDLVLLLKHFSLDEIISFYNSKYEDSSTYLALKSLVYFEDADKQPDPIMFDKISWAEVKSIISIEHKKHLRNIEG